MTNNLIKSMHGIRTCSQVEILDLSQNDLTKIEVSFQLHFRALPC